MKRKGLGRHLLVLNAVKEMANVSKGFSWESFAKILGIAITVLAFFLSYLSYRDAEKWKKAEFSVTQFRIFQQNISVQLVNQILDYDQKDLLLFKGQKSITINENDVDRALETDSVRSTFDTTESKIREVFDEYFDELSLFNRYYKEDVVDSSVLKPYLSYQIKLIADVHHKRKSQSLSRLQKRMWKYIDYYEFNDIKGLCKIFGYDIRPNKYPNIPTQDELEISNKN